MECETLVAEAEVRVPAFGYLARAEEAPGREAVVDRDCDEGLSCLRLAIIHFLTIAGCEPILCEFATIADMLYRSSGPDP